MIRECYRQKEPDRISPIYDIWNRYDSLTLKRDDESLEKLVRSVCIEDMDIGNTVDDFINDKEREMPFDLIGKKRLLAGNFAGLRIVSKSTICRAMSVPPDSGTKSVMCHGC